MAKAIFRSKQRVVFHGLWNMVNPVFRYMLKHSMGFRKHRPVNTDAGSTVPYISKSIQWILYHQGIQPDGGVSSWIQFLNGKTKIGTSYPEVTGYIIPTLFDYAAEFDHPEAFNAAIKAADFELSLQDPTGFFPGHVIGNLTGPSVFNSAQIIHGLVRAFSETQEEKYLSSAIKASLWICGIQEKDGSWGSSNFLGMKRVYDTKTSQALLEVYKQTDYSDLLDAANRNMDFVLHNQKENGWFYNCDNSHDRNNAPLTHTIGYTTDGLLKCYLLIKREDLLDAAVLTLKALMHQFELGKGLLPGRFYSDWKPAVTSSCITGNAQISIGWMDLYEILRDYQFLNTALKMNDRLKGIQYDCRFKEIDGSLPSSYPFWGDYFTYNINSWGVKYVTDAFIQEYRIKMRLEDMFQ